MTESELAAVRELHEAAPKGPYHWEYAYGLSDGTHWCLSSPETDVNGCCLDGELVTETTRRRELPEDCASEEGGAPLSDRPLWRLLAGSWEAVGKLLDEVDRLSGLVHDLQQDGEALAAAERSAVLDACRNALRRRHRQRKRVEMYDLETQALGERGRLSELIPPDAARAEAERLREALREVAAALEGEVPRAARAGNPAALAALCAGLSEVAQSARAALGEG